jgi:hypothetical protein
MARLSALLPCGALLALVLTSLPAQETETAPASGIGPYWKAELKDGVFLVPHSAITSISRSNYIVDGSIRVTEISIGTQGSVQGRFYHAEPIEPTLPVGQSSLNLLKERVEEVQSRLGLDEQATKVLKNYPATTHAHTVEFRLPTLTELDAIFQHLERSYLQRRTAVYASKKPD